MDRATGEGQGSTIVDVIHGILLNLEIDDVETLLITMSFTIVGIGMG